MVSAKKELNSTVCSDFHLIGSEVLTSICKVVKIVDWSLLVDKNVQESKCFADAMVSTASEQ